MKQKQKSSMQFTIKKEIKANGVGIHYNKKANLTLKPASPNSGIIIRRIDVTDKNNVIKAHYLNIYNTDLSTKLMNEDGVLVATVEHLLAALSAYKITNLIIEIDASEMPIMEGGSEDFCFMLECAGVVPQDGAVKRFKLVKEIMVGDEKSYIVAEPSAEFSVSFTSNFRSDAIGEQKFFYTKDIDFVKNIAPAKTIANFDDVKALQNLGFGLGGSLKNTLVFNANNILNETCIYNKEDFVRHKMLDFIGDIYLAGGDVLANFNCFKSGHKLNHEMLKTIFSDSSNYQVM